MKLLLRIFGMGLILMAYSGGLSAQKVLTLNGSPEIDNSKVKQTHWSVGVPEASTVKVGEAISLTFSAQILSEGWHLYSAQPSEDFAYMPTEFYLDEEKSKDIELSGLMQEANKAAAKKDEVMGMIRFFEEKGVVFSQSFTITGKKPRLQGEIYGQICLDPEKGGQCIPLRVPVSWNLTGK